MKLPLGDSDFKNIIQENFSSGLVDKTLFIRDFIDSNAKTALITRPRRFGKTLNMSMLRHFFEVRLAQENRPLFLAMKIAKTKTKEGKYCLEYQGKHPVVFMSLKDLRSDSTYELAMENLAILLSDVYGEHRYLLDNSTLFEDEKAIYQTIINRKATQKDLEHSLKKLTEYLHRYYKVKPIILIDEYDAPFHAAYLASPKYYEKMCELMGGLLGQTFKDNEHLYKGLLTGILRISLLNLFSGTNNIPVYSVLEPEYAEYFGFTEIEVIDLLAKADMADNFAAIKAWYNGYEIGGVFLYNPWSIINCLAKQGRLESYWIASAGADSMIKDNLRKQSVETKLVLEALLRNETVSVTISERTMFTDLATDANALWGLLVYAGYLKVITVIRQEITGEFTCLVKVPNQEVLREYFAYVQIWHEEALGRSQYNAILQHLVTGNTASFAEDLQTYLMQTISYFDLGPNSSEQIYQVFLLGLIAGLSETHTILSNRESGFGRYDIVIIPKDLTKLAIILELKSLVLAKTVSDKKLAVLLDQAAKQALAQIEERQYISDLQQRGLQKILKIGVAFAGKHLKVATA